MGNGSRGEVTLMYGAVVSLVCAMLAFLYLADPTVRSAFDFLWGLLRAA
jgi:hypothetical protein